MRFASTFEEGLHAPFCATTREIEGGRVRWPSRRRYLHFTPGSPLGRKKDARMHKYWIGSIFALVLTSMSPIALAQESTPPPVVHGFDDLAFKNDYITPRGLLVTNKGL